MSWARAPSPFCLRAAALVHLSPLSSQHRAARCCAVRADDNIQASHAAAGSSALARIKCQVTRKLMTEPVRNVGCGHVYEKSGIETLRKPGKAWLYPIAGCKKPISELVADGARVKCVWWWWWWWFARVW